MLEEVQSQFQIRILKIFWEKPLIYYTIKEVLKSRYVDDYIISTDSKKIGDVAKKYGAKVPFYRPKKISKDNSPPQEALVHGLELYEKISKKV